MSKYVPATICAKAVRAILKEKFPETKFAVRTQRGTGSIRVYWTDGPTESDVQEATAILIGDKVDFTGDYVDPLGPIAVSAFEGEARKIIAAFAEGDTHVYRGSSFIFVDRDYSRESWDLVAESILRHEPTARFDRTEDGAIKYEYAGDVWMPDHDGERILSGAAWFEVGRRYLHGLEIS